MSNENEEKEKARDRKGNMLDSFTIGSAVKDGAWKVYFNVEEEAEKKPKETKAYKLLQLKQGMDGVPK